MDRFERIGADRTAEPPARAAALNKKNARTSSGGIVKPLNPILLSGREVLPLVEGGKGVAVSNGDGAGH